MAADVYSRLGFVGGGNEPWTFDCAVRRILAPEWILIENVTEEMHA